jgi:hypothetical protein
VFVFVFGDVFVSVRPLRNIRNISDHGMFYGMFVY